MYLLDTNIVSDIIRNPQGAIVEKIRDVGEDKIFISIVVASELRFGAFKSGSKRLSDRVDSILTVLQVDSFKSPADQHYARIRTALESDGQIIGANDLLIAAHALATDSIVVTANEKEFVRVPGLSIENWL